MWLINDALRAQLERAFDSGWHVTPEIETRMRDRRVNALDTNSVSDGVARINIIGPLTKNPDPFVAFFLGANTAFSDINEQLNAAVGSSDVSSIELFIDSPGGSVDGLFETLDTIKAARAQKPISVRADNAHSAAFAIAAAAGPIVATSRGSMFGSIGVATSFLKDDPIGSITSTEAPDKRPDPQTAEGRETIVAQLDAIHELFVGSIAEGRDTAPDAINKGFGRGASFMANEALNRGMIDDIAQPSLSAVPNQKELGAMTLEELKAQHPAVYNAAVAEGTKQERDRVCAHLTLGEQSGDRKTALDAINAGEGLTATYQAKYMAASMNRRDTEATQNDSDEAGEALNNTGDASEDFDSLGAQVASIVEEKLGIGAGA